MNARNTRYDEEPLTFNVAVTLILPNVPICSVETQRVP